jgi:hypothetical protein
MTIIERPKSLFPHLVTVEELERHRAADSEDEAADDLHTTAEDDTPRVRLVTSPAK